MQPAKFQQKRSGIIYAAPNSAQAFVVRLSSSCLVFAIGDNLDCTILSNCYRQGATINFRNCCVFFCFFDFFDFVADCCYPWYFANKKQDLSECLIHIFCLALRGVLLCFVLQHPDNEVAFVVGQPGTLISSTSLRPNFVLAYTQCIYAIFPVRAARA